MSKQPLFSICTPCYNHEKFLADYFKSLLMQKYRNIEIVLIDDCSNDASVKIIEDMLPRLKSRFSNVIFKKHTVNQGLVKTCNELAKTFTGDYVWFLASDDMLLPHAVSDAVQVLSSRPNFLSLQCNGYWVDEHYHYGDFLGFKHRNFLGKDMSKFMCHETFKNVMKNFNCVFAPGVVRRREAFAKIGYYDEDIPIEDYDYWLRIAEHEGMLSLNKALVLYRRNAGSMSSSKKNLVIMGDALTRIKHSDFHVAARIVRETIYRFRYIKDVDMEKQFRSILEDKYSIHVSDVPYESTN